MFKQFIILSALASSGLVFADTGEQKTFLFQGRQQSESLDLRGEKTHTEYRQEQVSRTCYNQVFDGYDTVCRDVPYTRCNGPITLNIQSVLGMLMGEAIADDRPGRGGGDRRPDRPGNGGGDRRPDHPGNGGGDRRPDRPGNGGGDRRPDHPGNGGGDRRPDRPGNGGGDRRPDRPGNGGGDRRPDRPGNGGGDRRPDHPRCYTDYRRECSQEARYRSEPYTCYDTVSVPYEVKDADTLAHVKVEFDNVPDQAQADDQFTVKLNGRELALYSQGRNELIYFYDKSVTQKGDGNLIEMDVVYHVRMLPTAQVNAPVSQGLTNLGATEGVVSFNLGQASLPQSLVLNLKIKEKKTFKDKTLIERDLLPTEYTLVPAGNTTRVEIQTSRLSMAEAMTDGKFEITATARLNVVGSIANPGAVSTLAPSQSITVKIK